MATLEEIVAELRALREGQDQLRGEVRDETRRVREEMAEGFDRVELKIQKIRSDILQLDKDLNKHMEVHRELETEIMALKSSKAARVGRAARPRR